MHAGVPKKRRSSTGRSQKLSSLTIQQLLLLYGISTMHCFTILIGIFHSKKCREDSCSHQWKKETVNRRRAARCYALYTVVLWLQMGFFLYTILHIVDTILYSVGSASSLSSATHFPFFNDMVLKQDLDTKESVNYCHFTLEL